MKPAKLVEISLALVLMPLVAPAARAQDPVLQLAGGAEHFCALDVEGLKCWGTSRREVPRPDRALVRMRTGPCLADVGSAACAADDAKVVPEFERFAAGARLFVGGENTCVVEGAVLRCFGRVPELANAPAAATFGAGGELFLSQTHACWQTRGRRPSCWAPLPRAEADRLAPPVDVGWPLHAGNFAAGAGLSCALMADVVACEGLYAPRFLGPSLRVPAAPLIAVRDVAICALMPDTAREGVWSLGCHEDLTAAGAASMPVVASGLSLAAPSRLLLTRRHVCVRDDAGVACLDRADAAAGLVRVPRLQRAASLAAAGDQLCGVVGIDVACEDLVRRAPVPLPARVRLALHDFELATLGASLRRLAEFVYLDKAALLARVADEVDALPLAASVRADDRPAAVDPGAEGVVPRLFVMHALTPLLERLETPYVQRNVYPGYAAVLAAYGERTGLASLAAFDRRDLGLARLGLALAAEATRGLRAQQADPTLAAPLDAATAKIGRALAAWPNAEAFQAARTALAATRVATEESLRRDTAVGQALLQLTLIEYFAAP